MPSAPAHSGITSSRAGVTDHPNSTLSLWHRLAAFPANETDAALLYLQEWIANEIDADNLI